MPQVFDRQTRQVITVASEDLPSILQSERYVLAEDPSFIAPETGSRVRAADPDQAMVEGRLAPEGEAARDVRAQEQFLEREYGGPGSGILTALEGLGSGATLGLIDPLMPGGTAIRARLNPIARGVGEVGGMVGTSLLTGGAGTAGAIARATPAGLAFRASETAAKRLVGGAPGLGRGLARGAAAGGLEGTAFGVGQSVSQAALSDDPLTVQSVAAHIGTGALLGAGVGAAFRGIHEGTAKLLRKKETPLDELATSLRSVDDAAEGFLRRPKEWIDQRATGKQVDALAGPAPLVRRAPGGRDWEATVARAREVQPSEAALARQEIQRAAQSYKSARKALAEDIGEELDIQRILSRKPASAVNALQKVDNFAKAVAQLDEVTAGRLGVGELFNPQAVDDLMGKFLSPEAFQSLKRMTNHDIADVLGVKVSKIEGLGPAKPIAQLYTAARLIRGQEGKKHGSRVVQAMKHLAFAMTPVRPGGTVGHRFWQIHRRHTMQKMIDRVANPLQSADSATSRISESIGRFIQNATKGATARRAAAATGTAILSKARFHWEPSDKKNPALARIDELKRLMGSPEGMRSAFEAAVAPITMLNPLTGMKVADALQARVDFLLSKAPRPITGGLLSMARGEMPISDEEVSRWARYVKAAEDPLSILDDLEAGRLTPQGVEAVKTLYPDLFQKIQVEILEQIVELREGIAYQPRLQLSLMFEVPVEPTATPEMFRTMQQLFVQEQPQVSAPQGVPGEPDQATKGQRSAAMTLTGN